MAMKRTVLAAPLVISGLLALAAFASGPAFARVESRNSPQVHATAFSGSHTYAKTSDAILAADLDAIVTKARTAGATAPSNAAVTAIVVMDELAAGRPSSARSFLDTAPERYRGGARDLIEAWVLLGESNKAEALTRAKDAAPRLPGKLGGLLPALIAEASGDLAAADTLYTQLQAQLDVAPPPEDEPDSLAEAMSQLAAPQTTQILYRAALVKQRLGKRDEAKALYDIVEKFAPNSPDVALNITRLQHNQPPFEPPLDLARGLGRWSLFLSEEFGRTESLAQVLQDPTPQQGLVSPSSMLFALMGVALDPSANDWALGSAYTLLRADGLDGAERLLKRIPADSPYGPDAAIGLAEVALKRNDNSRAADEAQRAERLAPTRWTVALSAAGVLTRAEKDAPAISAYNSALARAVSPRDKADILISRAGANNYFGRVDRAADDGRAAVAADSRSAIKIAAIGYLLEYSGGWDEAVKLGRQLLAEKPESVARLNQLGYTLIHRPEGLEEGYRLLSRGVALGQNDYAVVDSLGWANYLYGDFDQAEALIQRAVELSPEPIGEILDHLGDVQWRLGKQDDARATWRKALDAKPEAQRRAALSEKLAKGLTAPAPARGHPPVLAPFTPGQRSDT